jgi:hypothetical protein
LSKSLRKSRKISASKIERLNPSLHLVAGKHEHNVTHSHVPISASELEKLNLINPKYADTLLEIIKSGIENDKKDRESFYAAVNKEQENDRLAIEGQVKNKQTSMIVAGAIVFGFLAASMAFLAVGQYEIGGGLITIGLIGVLTAIFKKEKTNEDK